MRRRAIIAGSGVAVVTFGAGAFNLVNAVAGAYAGMGFGVPASIGVAAATGLPLILVGDGRLPDDRLGTRQLPALWARSDRRSVQ